MGVRNWDFNPGVVAEFRANGGTVGGQFAGKPLLLLTTTGATSGEPRTSPLLYFTDNGRIYVLASASGAARHPGWYHNLLANPEASIEIGTEHYRVRASVAEGAERERLFAAAAAADPKVGESQERTNREIPVVFLDPVS